MHDRRGTGGSEGSVSPGRRTLTEQAPADGVAPGRRTLTENLPVQSKATPDAGSSAVQRKDAAGSSEDAPAEAAVQRSEAGTTDLNDTAVHRAAARGTAGAGGALPFLDRIQRAFGPAHDLSGIRAHVGGTAAEAATQIGADAYAMGNQVAFHAAPDLHTAAHEAAHVVQQQRGVHLKGGVGESGDVYEQHADAVADRVVHGESAADLLDAGPTAGSVTRGVQRSARDQAVAEMNRIVALIKAHGGALYSDRDAEEWDKLTGTSQSTMQADWDAGKRVKEIKKKPEDQWTDEERQFVTAHKNSGIMTACNGFAGTFGSTAVAPGPGEPRSTHPAPNVGRFDVAKTAVGAFVPAARGRAPKPGDVVKMKATHMCISYNAPIEDGPWQVLEAGQGGPGAGHDILKFDDRTYSTANVEGWVDIDAWGDPGVRARAPMAGHLVGSWQVKVGEWRVWRYDFSSSSNTVVYTDSQNAAETGSGKWDWDGTAPAITITWDKGSTEQWPVPAVQNHRGSGTLSTGDTSAFQKTAAAPGPATPPSVSQQLQQHGWKVAIGWRNWRYQFDGSGHVRCVDAVNAAETFEGTWAAEGHRVTIHWSGSDSQETWDVPDPIGPFSGQRSNGENSQVTPT
jgi:hypothetical protein